MKPSAVIGFGLLGCFLFLAVAGPYLTPYPAGETRYDRALRPPDRNHLMGTDPLGRDLFSRLICGTRTTLGLALAIAVLNALVAVSLGALAGFLGGWVDVTIMRLADALMSLPGFLLAVCFLGIFGGGPWHLVLFLSLTGWASLARVVRNEMTVVRNLDYITANAAAGYSRSRNLLRHALPAILPSLLVLFVISLIGDMFAVVSTSFLGLGISPQIPEWGLALRDARDYILTSPWLFVFPSALIGIFSMGLHLAADGLREMFDAKRFLFAGDEVALFSRRSSGLHPEAEIEP